jgi:hypothetical protein
MWKRFQIGPQGSITAGPILMTLPAMTPSSSDVGAVRGIALKAQGRYRGPDRIDDNNALFEVPCC